MSATNKPVSQSYYEDVEALKASGVSNADAIRQVADKYGKNVNAVRGGIHQWRSRHVNGGTTSGTRRTRRTAATSVESAVADARRLLESARSSIDREIDGAKAELDAAQQRYDQLISSAEERKRDLENKIRLLGE